MKNQDRTVVYTTGNLARIFGVATRTVGKWADAGKIKCTRLPDSKDRRFYEDDVIQFAKSYDFTAALRTLLKPILYVGTYLGFENADTATNWLEAGYKLGRYRYLYVILDCDLGTSEMIRAVELIKSRDCGVRTAILLADDDDGRHTGVLINRVDSGAVCFIRPVAASEVLRVLNQVKPSFLNKGVRDVVIRSNDSLLCAGIQDDRTICGGVSGGGSDLLRSDISGIRSETSEQSVGTQEHPLPAIGSSQDEGSGVSI